MKINPQFTGRMVRVNTKPNGDNAKGTSCIDAEKISSVQITEYSCFIHLDGKNEFLSVDAPRDKFQLICKKINEAKTTPVGDIIDLTKPVAVE